MPNLTSYQAPAIHLKRELPKNYCDLISHEMNYSHFLRTRLANIQSSLTSTKPKPRFSSADREKINGNKRMNISHFRLRQKRWKDKVDHENQRFIQSLLYRREKYRPLHDRYAAQKSFEKHLKLLQMMSEYSKYNRTYSICQNFLKKIRLNPLKTNQYSRRSNSYIENMFQQTINQTIRIYNQPLPSPPTRMKSAYSQIDQRIKPSLYRGQKLFRSVYGVNSLDLGLPQTGRKVDR